MTYIITLIISMIFFALSEKYHSIGCRINNTKAIVLPNSMAIIAIFVLALIAGLRDQSIGLDVTTYDIYLFPRVQSYTSFLEVTSHHSLEIGYELLAYFSAKINGDLHFFHFITSLITISGIYYFSKKNLNGNYVTLSMFIFFCLYYNNTFNIMRQWIAISIFAASVHLLFEKKYLIYIFFSLLAVLFHSSAIVFIVFLLIYIFLNSNKNSKVRVAIIIGIVVFVVLYFNQLINVFAKFGFVSLKYIEYNNTTGNSSIIAQVISRISVIILGIILYNRLDKDDNNNHFIFSLLIIDLLLGCMSVVIGDGARISLYFGVWQCVFIPRCLSVLKKQFSKNQLLILYFVIIAYYSAYWFYCIPIRNFGETYPYISDIITWLR